MRVYVGPKQKTIENTNYFDKSITLVGNNISNIALSNKLPFDYWNPDSNMKEINYYNQQLSKITEDIEVMAHNPHLFSQCTFPNNVHFVCKNKDSLLTILDDKIKTRELFIGLIPMLKYENCLGKTFLRRKNEFINKQTVIQLPYGSGGAKTFLYNSNTMNRVEPLIINEEYYSISEYQENNIPYNIHCIIGENEIELMPPSEQDLEITDKIEYIGSFFVIKIPQLVKEKIINYSSIICKKLQSLGYRGILGIDWIYANNELYFIEINPRFQGSTRQVDLLLKKSNLPSIFELNYLAFYRKHLPNTKDMLFSLYEKEN